MAAFVRDHRPSGEPLETFAYRLGISRIVREALPFEGGLFDLPGGELIIKLNANSPLTRGRFTLAHELAHLLLDTVPAFRKATSQTDELLERACDMIAAELLMPSHEARQFIQDLGSPSPEKLKTLADRYTVSLHAAAIRVHFDFQLWKCFIGCWECRPKIRTTWFVGRRLWDRTEPDSGSLGLALSSDGSVQSKEVWQRGPNPSPVWLNLLRLDDARVLGLIGFVN